MQLLSSVHVAPEKFENATFTGHSGFVFEKNSEHGNRMITLL